MPDYEEKALLYAEKHGIYEYKVHGNIMEYISLYEEGYIYTVIDLESETQIYRGQAFPWMGFIPYWLETETGATRYNYMEG